MKIGIIGVGMIGKTLVQKLSAAGHEVKAAKTRGPETVDPQVFANGGRAVTTAQAVEDVDVVIVSVMWLQTIMLLLREEGLDSCAQQFMTFHARTIKEEIGVSDDNFILLCGLAIGERVADMPINDFERQRAWLDEQVSFLGFN